MKVTEGAVKCLVRGAVHPDPDVNAVGAKGELHEAGQLISEGNEGLRQMLGADEFQPVLEVVKTDWHGSMGKNLPNLRI